MRAPERGEIHWMDFDPVRGHEQRGRRPALVLSPGAYNRVVGLCLVCPVTSKAKSYEFEVPLEATGVVGVALADAVRSVSWPDRLRGYAGQATPETVEEVLRRARILLTP